MGTQQCKQTGLAGPAGSQKLASAGKNPLPKVKAQQMPSITHRRWSLQSATVALACRVSFNRLWSHSTRPSDWGLCAVVGECMGNVKHFAVMGIKAMKLSNYFQRDECLGEKQRYR